MSAMNHTAVDAGTAGSLDIERVRADFPILAREVHGQPVAYLDNAATAQKPRAVIDAVRRYYEHSNANIHRAVHVLGEEATRAYEEARDKTAQFINAADRREVVFLRGTTEAVNLVAQSYARPRLQPGDEIVVTHMEHHSNIVPWQLVCEQTGARLRVAPINDRGELLVDELEALLSERVKLVALVHVSNALGTVNPVADVVERAHARGIPVLVDGAQAAPHLQVDVRALGCDFYCLSGHKMFAPTGIGALYGRLDLLEDMPPYHGGGEMIRKVSFEGSSYKRPPGRFEAGTPNIAGAVGLGAAIDYLTSLGHEAIEAYERELLDYATEALSSLPGLRIIGTARDKVGVVSFVMDEVHAHDLGTIVDTDGVAIRTGHHCAMPLMERLGVAATSRASMAFYNSREEIDRLVAALDRARGMFA